MTILQIKDTLFAQEIIQNRRVIATENRTVEANVRTIINQVQAKGDAGLLEYTRKYDHVELKKTDLQVAPQTFSDAYDQVHRTEIAALMHLKKRIEQVEQRKLDQMHFSIQEHGLEITHTTQPIESVGCYVPGGEAVYPSTLLMTVLPAKIAKVPRIVVCSPPTTNGEINPLILVAASLCNVDEVYRLGGAQAIAALSYGTESISPVRKIVGPGNIFVTIAKMLVSRDVAIDLPAGPSEILVLADETANPKFIALDLISQAEHTADNIAGVVTTSRELAENICQEVEEIAPQSPRSQIVANSLTHQGFIVCFKQMDDAIGFVNRFAPEHLEIHTRKPRQVATQITSAGIVLVGEYTPVSVSDYCIGTNHVLPTAGSGHIYSELSVLDYVKRINIVECSREKLRSLQRVTQTLAQSEGLVNHARAIQGRFTDG
ncbi:MAG: histidinol dehydrogenase [Candidatus Bathyarchaeota archaeon]|nr:MAG: histidinol dehydrogenase [Candidatus Bathyarchaeota archaeon]